MNFLFQPLTLVTFFPLVGVLVILFLTRSKRHCSLDGDGHLADHLWHLDWRCWRCSTRRPPDLQLVVNMPGSRWLDWNI